VTEDEQDPSDSPPAEATGEAGDRGVAGFVTGLIVGALVGAGLALLFAPSRGDRLRRRLGRGARELRERARDELERAARHARREIARRR
jgi:gas vesicle protein